MNDPTATTKREWPADWNERVRGKDCAMCADGRAEVAHGSSRIFEGRVSDAYLTRIDVGQPGYSVVIWRGRHVSDPTELSKDEASAYFDEVLRVGRAIEKQLHADQDELRDARQFPAASAHARGAALSRRRRTGPSTALHARGCGLGARAEDPGARIRTRPRRASRIATRLGLPARAPHPYSAR